MEANDLATFNVEQSKTFRFAVNNGYKDGDDIGSERPETASVVLDLQKVSQHVIIRHQKGFGEELSVAEETLAMEKLREEVERLERERKTAEDRERAVVAEKERQAAIERESQAAVERERHAAAGKERTRQLAQNFLRQGTDRDGVTPLHRAAQQGLTSVVEYLVANHVPLEARMHKIDNSTDHSHGTPLHWATIAGHVYVVKALLDAGAWIEALNAWRRTPLHLAARFGHLDIVKLLVGRGAYKEARRDTNETPLHFAVEENRYNVVEYLLDMRADVNAWGNRGTPLAFAYAKGHSRIASLLTAREGRM